MSTPNRKNTAAAAKRAAEQQLMPWSEIVRRWQKLSGQKLSRARVWQICHAAEKKIRKALSKRRE